MIPLHSVEDVPTYLHEAFIHGGYRKDLSLSECMASIFTVHNETVNIWTHGVVAVVFWRRFFRMAQSHRGHPLALYCACFAAVFSASFLAHTFSAFPSEEVYRFLWRLDWSMISVAMFGTFHALVHSAYHHDKRLKVRWTRLFGISTATMFGAVNMPGFVGQSTGLKAFGGLIPIPCLVAFVVDSCYRLPKVQVAQFAQDMVGPIMLSIVGLAIYGSASPERFYDDGRFDCFGNSHNIHHAWTILFSVWMYRNAKSWPISSKDELPLMYSSAA